MIDALRNVVRVNPCIWQLPNALKIHEFESLAGGMVFRRGQRLLDLGCGRGIQTQLLAARGADILGVDPQAKCIQSAERALSARWVRRRVTFTCGTIETMRLPAASFDAVFSFCVLEHIPNLDEVLVELHRLLRPGGEIHVTVDSLSNIHDAAIIDKHRIEYKVHQYFSPQSLASVFQKAHFELVTKEFILVSELARDEMVRGLLERDTLCPRRERRRAYAHLVRHESANHAPTSGLMILARARKI